MDSREYKRIERVTEGYKGFLGLQWVKGATTG